MSGVLTCGPPARLPWQVQDTYPEASPQQPSMQTGGCEDCTPASVSQVLEVDVATESGAERLADAISADFGAIDYAVSAIGSASQKGMLPGRVAGVTHAACNGPAVIHSIPLVLCCCNSDQHNPLGWQLP